MPRSGVAHIATCTFDDRDARARRDCGEIVRSWRWATPAATAYRAEDLRLRLELPYPAGWKVEPRPDGSARAIVPGHRAAPDLWLDVSPVRAAPVGRPQLLSEGLGADLPAGATLKADEPGRDRARAGWRVEIGSASVVDGSGTPVQRRMLAAFRFGGQVATVLVVGTDPTRWKAQIDSIGKLVMGGTLAWSGDAACLAEVLEVPRDHPAVPSAREK